MGDKCVFFDRDRTIIEDPGYLTDPEAVKLMPGVDLAMRGLADEGFKLVVVTNQSAVARGMITEEGLEKIHDELRRQLGERGVELDAIYYCPYHPDGTVEEYARESVDRKPQPGMLLRAAKELTLDLTASWMVGDSPRDVEAGQRAGCRTIRVRSATEDDGGDALASRETPHLEAGADEDAQADFTVRNLVDAARVIVREVAGAPAVAAGEFDAAGTKTAGAQPVRQPLDKMSNSQVLREIASHLREQELIDEESDFSISRLAATLVQMLAIVALIWGLVSIPGIMADESGLSVAVENKRIAVHVALLTAGVLQLVALTFFVISRRR